MNWEISDYEGTLLMHTPSGEHIRVRNQPHGITIQMSAGDRESCTTLTVPNFIAAYLAGQLAARSGVAWTPSQERPTHADRPNEG